MIDPDKLQGFQCFTCLNWHLRTRIKIGNRIDQLYIHSETTNLTPTLDGRHFTERIRKQLSAECGANAADE